VSAIYANMAQDNANSATKQQQIRHGTADYRNKVKSNRGEIQTALACWGARPCSRKGPATGN
jgi:hypothetical protein